MPNNMGFTPPPVGQDGPEWAENINDILNTNIADHDHTSGKGIPVTPAGINIDADLSMNANNLTDARTVRLQELATTSSFGAQDINALYDYNGDLYFVDGNQTAIRITQGGGLSPNTGGQINGLSGSSGEANFAAGTFEWLKQGSPNKEYANMENGPVFVYSGNDTNPANSVQLRGVDSLASNSILQLSPVNITLPQAHPAATSFVTMSAAGVMGTGPVTAQGIGPSQLTPVNFASGNIDQVDASWGYIFTTGSSFQNIPGLSASLDLSGLRPVRFGLIGKNVGSGGQGIISLSGDDANTGNEVYIRIQAVSGATTQSLNLVTYGCPPDYDLNGDTTDFPVSSYNGFIDILSAGTWTFRVQGYATYTSTPFTHINNCALVVQEL